MTAAQCFARWLASAMRAAGLDIDSQQGGGRAALADACGVSRSTVSRWLEGTTLPSAEHFSKIATAVNVTVTDLMLGAGLISPEDSLEPSAGPPSIEDVAEQWGIRPEDRRLFFVVADELKRRAHHPST